MAPAGPPLAPPLATRVVKGGTQKKLGNVYSHLDEK
jgi:hypothetical protein